MSGSLFDPFRYDGTDRFCETAYVDDNLLGTGKVSKAAIIGLKGGVWAASPNYSVRAMLHPPRRIFS